MRVALAHDYLVEAGGAERVLAVFRALFPAAPIYTSVFDARTVLRDLRHAPVITSFLQRLPHSRAMYKFLLPLYPLAFESFDLSGYDVVLSSTTSFAKGVITGPNTVHFCFCHTPARFAWRYHDYVRRERFGAPQRRVLSMLVHYLRVWDVYAARRVDHFIANCQNTASRIRKYYRRDATVIYSPIDTSFYTPSHPTVAAPPVALPPSGYFLLVSRLVPYKRADIAVSACTRLGVPLVIVGDGTALSRLQESAGPSIHFAGRVSDETLREYYRRCAAVLFPGEEDFGLVPLESNACGRPVVAFRAGGALETVVEGVTGTFFDAQTPECLAEVLCGFDPAGYDPVAIRNHALQFDTEIFKRRILDHILSRPPNRLRSLPEDTSGVN